MIKVGLVGVTGYTGMELARLLEGHPSMKLKVVTSRQEAGRKLFEIYPFLQGFDSGELVIQEPDPSALAKECALVFLAVPHGTAMNMGAALRAAGCKVVDLSADCRLRDKSVYEQWYKIEHTQPALLSEAVYGLPEIYAEKITAAGFIANPGCYPTASILGLYPALAGGFIETENIVIDAKSGTSGAGRGLNLGSLFCEVHDSFKAYNLAGHRHTPEIEQELGFAAKKAMTISFNTHLLPVTRGILATIYTRLSDPDMPLERIRTAYESFYAPHRFVRILPAGKLPDLRSVRGTMFCDIGLVHDPRTGRLIIVSCIDNLCRGASGQAIACANLMLGLPLQTGLDMPALAP